MMKSIIHILFLSACLIHHAPAEEKPTVIKNGAGVPVEYRRGLTVVEKGLQNLAEHRMIARHKGAPYELCKSESLGCPERCGASGESATFEVESYFFYVKQTLALFTVLLIAATLLHSQKKSLALTGQSEYYKIHPQFHPFPDEKMPVQAMRLLQDFC